MSGDVGMSSSTYEFKYVCTRMCVVYLVFYFHSQLMGANLLYSGHARGLMASNLAGEGLLYTSQWHLSILVFNTMSTAATGSSLQVLGIIFCYISANNVTLRSKGNKAA